MNKNKKMFETLVLGSGIDINDYKYQLNVLQSREIRNPIETDIEGNPFSYKESSYSNITCVDKMYKEFDGKYFYGYNNNNNLRLVGRDIFKFLESSLTKYDIIHACRIFEHVDYNKIPYLLYLLYNVSTENTNLVFTVPDFNRVASMVKNITKSDNPSNFNKEMINVHTELFNEPSDPHRSIWTKELIYYYTELEHYWKILKLDDVTLHNRDWYIQVTCIRG